MTRRDHKSVPGEAAPTVDVAGGPVGDTRPRSKSKAAPVRFTDLHGQPATGDPRDVSFLYDIPVQVSVRLGGARLLLRDLLGLGPGSVVELDRMAGEPLEVLVNGRLLARGEAVVVNGKFGVRLTELVDTVEDGVSPIAKE